MSDDELGAFTRAAVGSWGRSSTPVPMSAEPEDPEPGADDEPGDDGESDAGAELEDEEQQPDDEQPGEDAAPISFEVRSGAEFVQAVLQAEPDAIAAANGDADAGDYLIWLATCDRHAWLAACKAAGWDPEIRPTVDDLPVALSVAVRQARLDEQIRAVRAGERPHMSSGFG